MYSIDCHQAHLEKSFRLCEKKAFQYLRKTLGPCRGNQAEGVKILHNTHQLVPLDMNSTMLELRAATKTSFRGC